MIGGCNFSVEVDSDTPTLEVPTSGPDADMPSALFVREAVLAHIAARVPVFDSLNGLSWIEEIITPAGLVGSSTFQYTASPWMITVTFPIVAPEATIYQAEVTNQEAGFFCQVEVNAFGDITEKQLSPGYPSIRGWMGSVLSAPQGSPFDDYVVMLPEGSGRFGIEGSDEAIQAAIISLRDREEPEQLRPD